MLSPETVLQGRYRIVRQLGQGGMGAVYEALDQRLDTVVALKETLFTDEKLRKQFEREARLLARMHHQALPRVSDHFNEGDGQFLVMQYIAGEDFYEMLTRRNAPFPQQDVLRWGDQLCDALDYLHTQDPQIIHRDIKPQNLKLTARGQAVLLDFGLAKGSAGQMSVVTTSASIFGYTPNYAPLEQVQGLGTDARSDLYSLSATLYHLLTNIKPPDALSRAAAMVNGQPDPLMPANQVGGVSAAVAATLNKGMAQKRDDRYPSAALMREALKIAAEHPAGEAPAVLASSSGLAAAKTVANEQRTSLPAGKTVPMASEAQTLIGGDATNVRPSNSLEAATVVRPPANPKKSRMLPAAAVLMVLIVGSVGAFYLYRARKSGAQQTAVTNQPEPQTQKQSIESGPAPGSSSQNENSTNSETKTEKSKAETAAQRNANPKAPAEKAAEPNKPVTNQTTNSDETAHENGRDPNRRNPNETVPPQIPPPFPNRNQTDRGPGHPPAANQPGVRTFPNGVTIETKPDGTRIVTMRNGTTRVIPPGEKPSRRRPPEP
jgi:serine/threonine protein kinase